MIVTDIFLIAELLSLLNFSLPTKVKSENKQKREYEKYWYNINTVSAQGILLALKTIISTMCIHNNVWITVWLLMTLIRDIKLSQRGHMKYSISLANKNSHGYWLPCILSNEYKLRELLPSVGDRTEKVVWTRQRQSDQSASDNSLWGRRQ